MDPAPNAIQTVEDTFAILTRHPRPLCLDGRGFPGILPARMVPLCELREIVLSTPLTTSQRDFLVAELVLAARADSTWMVGLVGVMAPGIKATLTRYGPMSAPQKAEAAAEALAAFIEAVRSVDLARPHIAYRLIGAVRNRVRDLMARERAPFGRHCGPQASQAPPAPASHPEMALTWAVAAKVITSDEATLIADTRLGHAPMRALACETGCTYARLRKQRRRAELRLVRWLSDEKFSAPCPKRPLQ